MRGDDVSTYCHKSIRRSKSGGVRGQGVGRWGGIGNLGGDVVKTVEGACGGGGLGRFEGMKGMMKKSSVLQGVSSVLAPLPVMTCAGRIRDLV